MPPESARNRNLRVLRDGINKNRRRIGALNMAFNGGLQQQQQDINNLKNAIGDDNRKRDQNISEISHNLALLKSFVTEKLSNHSSDYEDFVNNLSHQPINNSIQGGKRKRKTRRKTKRKTKKRKSRKNRKTRRRKRKK